jgi:hypothetical protein
MSDKGNEEDRIMSAAYISDAKGMAEEILRHVHRGPGDTVDAAMHRAERLYGVPAKWLHRLRYRELKDMPVSAFAAIASAYKAVNEASERAFLRERELANVRTTKVLWLADLVAGKESKGDMK